VIAVIFEVFPSRGGAEKYFDIAASLKDDLERIEGFISVERFESVTSKGKYLSLSFWRDEQAVQQWRNLDQHRRAQVSGRKEVFADCRLRVATVIRDYGLNERDEAPKDSRDVNG